MKKNVTLVAFTGLVILSFFTIQCNSEGKKNDLTQSINKNYVKGDTLWAEYLTDVFIKRNPKHITYDINKIDWNYEEGVMLNAFWNVYQKTKDQKYFDYIKKNIDYYIDSSGNINTYVFKKFRLDDITPGSAVLDLYQATGNEKYKKAAELLRKQLSEQPRNKQGGFWHKEIYPHQMWLDGMYMAEPFYAKFAAMFNEAKDFDDIANQFILMAEHAKDSKTGLFYHGWDVSKKQKWADPKTGDSPSFWGRAMGWYLMGAVDVLDYFPENHPAREKIISIVKNLCVALMKVQDKKTNLWYLIVDKPGKAGNYLEASSSAMFMYVFAKGANKGYLDKKYFSYAKEIQKGLLNNLFKKGKDSYPDLTNTIRSAGLGGNPYRDGSFKYYTSEPKRVNDFKALGPFINGSLQLERE